MNESIPSLVYIDTTPHHPLLDENIVKIKQLEKENAELKNTIKVFKDENFECGICLDETLENERLRKENAELRKMLNGQVEYIEQLKNNLKGYREPKTLNREEVEKILWDVVEWSNLSEEYIFIEDPNDNFITAICNLALPKIDKEKIVKVLQKHQDYLGKFNRMGIRGTPESLATEIIKEINE